MKTPAFPVELYWGMIPGDDSVGYLVNPQEIEKWAEWDNEFFRKHLISDADVQNCGSHPSVICDAITIALSDKTVYSKDTKASVTLLTELFSVIGREVCKMELLDLEEFFLQKLSASRAADSAQALAEIKRQVAEAYPFYLCGGACEVLYYSEIWKRIS